MKIEFTTKEIVVSKKFLKEANIFGSEAYNSLFQALKDFPDFTIRVKQIKRRKQF